MKNIYWERGSFVILIFRYYGDGNVYLGEWKKGIRDGWGVFMYYSGAKYEGSWKDDKKHGFGVECKILKCNVRIP